MRIFRLLAIAILVIGILEDPAVAQTSIAEQQDAQVIESLKQGGADLSKVHDIDFFLMFASESDASSAASELAQIGYDVVAIEVSPDRTQWQVHAKRKMIPALDAMVAITRSFEALAQSHGGYYDGWGTEAVK